MWINRIALGLVVAFAVVVLGICLFADVTVQVALPPEHAPQADTNSRLFLAGWLIVLFSAVIIVAATLLKWAVGLTRRARNRSQ